MCIEFDIMQYMQYNCHTLQTIENKIHNLDLKCEIFQSYFFGIYSK